MHRNSVGMQQQQSFIDGHSQTDDTYLRNTSTNPQSSVNYPQTQAPKKENRSPKSFILSPVPPGTEGNLSPNTTRVLGTYSDISQTAATGTTLTPLTHCPSLHFVSQRQKLLPRPRTSGTGDVENESHELLRASEAPTLTDSSMSTQSSTSPRSTGTSTSPAGSSNSSPGSTAETAESPPQVTEEPLSKRIRTTYTNDQVQTLQTFFFENPYPDSEMMENIGKVLRIPENNVKIWFQNKRARSRRGMNDNSNRISLPFLQMSPMMQPVHPYGFMSASHMRASPLQQSVPRFLNNQWMQQRTSRNHSNQSRSRLQSTNQDAMSPQLVPLPVPPTADMSSTIPYLTPSQTQIMMSQQHQSLQYPTFGYKPSYGSFKHN